LERVLGYNAESRIGKNIFNDSIVHPDDREIEKSLLQKCIEKPYVYIRSEFRMKHKGDDYKIMEVGCINLANNTSIHGIIQFYRDITERRMLEKQKEEFIGVASHELKTPVTSIKAYTQILYEIFKEKKDEYSANLLLKMEGQIDRLSTLIKDLLDVTKITEGQLTLKREHYDMNELIKEVADEMQLTTKKHKITLNLSEMQPVIGDKNKTSQVIINLLSNAIKYSPEAHEVIISSNASDHEVTVCVHDFGIGISKEMQKKLFTRFFRVSDEVASTFSGLGLGLFISSEIVKNQNGRIWVESTPKEGATFCFSLPLK
jgi:PAS domain S-box-containing protein